MGLIFSYDVPADYESRLCALENKLDELETKISVLARLEDKRVLREIQGGIRSTEANTPPLKPFLFNNLLTIRDPKKVVGYQCSDELSTWIIEELEKYETEEELMAAHGFSTPHELEEYLDSKRTFSVTVEYDGEQYATHFGDRNEWNEFTSSLEAWMKNALSQNFKN